MRSLRRTQLLASGLLGLGALAPAFALPAQREPVARMLAQLKDPDPRVRDLAVKELGAAGSRRAVPALELALDDPNIQVRQDAAASLGRLRDPRAIGPLLDALRNAPSRNPTGMACGYLDSKQIVAALTRIGWPAVPRLVEALGDDPSGGSSIAPFAVQVLGGIGDPRVTGVLTGLTQQQDASAHVREHALEALALRKDPRATPALLAVLNAPAAQLPPSDPRKPLDSFSRAVADPTTGLRVRALNALEAMDTPEAAAAATAALASTNEFVRENAGRYLGERGLGEHSSGEHGAPTLAELAPALASPDAGTRCEALEALGRLRDPGVLAIVRSALGSANAAVRYAALVGLGGLLQPAANPEAVELLASAQHDHAARVRAAVLERMVEAGETQRAEPMLLDGLKDRSSDVRREAAIDLGRLRGLDAESKAAVVQALLGALDERGSGVDANVRVDALLALVALKAPDVESRLIAALRDPDEDLRWNAADELAKRGDPAAIGPLVAALHDETRNGVRMHLVRALATFDDPRAIDPLATLLETTGSQDDLFWTPRTLGDSRNPLAAAALVGLLQSARPETRAAAATGLAEMQPHPDPDAVEPLAAALRDSDAEVRQEAARALVSVADERAVPALLRALHDPDWEVRYDAAYALAHTGDPRATPAILATFATAEPGAVNAGVDALTESKDPAALPAVAAALGSPDAPVRLIAAQVLRYANDPRTFPALIHALDDSDAGVRQAAALALSGCPRPIPED